ncbi:Antitoxin component YwqK of the YwqJK toxin-antitoxin module [Mesonia phycicola]|uniref:Antitoxin component YwqK of the YwqJK toxin-antitoxin module n=1 Tax=Mesonia phycicola TaxID=579105 RepID=A0A1M6HD95_9FLAO|nr:hypothetical protein [Mesonia phycicola]SHJ20131.1 Antitoxin component YwqK of the YwqJK toxin-antitoxin module [Mesonia phycicola]
MRVKFKIIVFFIVISFFSCKKEITNNKILKTNSSLSSNSTYELSTINLDTIAFTNPDMKFVNGEYFFKNKPFTGIVFKILKGYQLKTYSSVINGKLNGLYQSFYPNGKPYEIRNYKDGLSVGKHIGYWENTGNLKFEYNYNNQQKEGLQKSWYANGDLAHIYNYKEDKLEGLQQAWRKNGSLYRNFIVKNGARYGLQKSKSCYELNDEKIVLQVDK